MIAANQDEHRVTKMCEVLGVSTSGFYDWQNRTPSQRDVDDGVVGEVLEQAWEDSGRSYGAPRLIPEVNDRLAAEGRQLRVGNRRARRLMCRRGIEGQTRRRWRKGSTRQDPAARPAPDLLRRDFTVGGPDLAWVSDITQIDTVAGPCWAAVVTDLWSRRIVGWSIADHHEASLVTAAMKMAIDTRDPAPGLIFHSDQGSEYTSWDVHKVCASNGMRQSMGSVGDCYDNAPAESVFATIETELLWHHTFTDLADAKSHLIDYIEGWYNTNRRHTAIGSISPIQFERAHETRYNEPERAQLSTQPR